MGYKPEKKKIYRITFAQYEGLELATVAPPLGKLMDIAELRLNMNEAAERRMEVFELFAKHIKVWNLEHPEPDDTKLEIPEVSESVVCARCGLAEGMPMPTTAEAMMCLELEFIMTMYFGWISIVSRVDPTRGMNLNFGGNNTQEDLMKKLADLQSPRQLPEPNLS